MRFRFHSEVIVFFSKYADSGRFVRLGSLWKSAKVCVNTHLNEWNCLENECFKRPIL